MWDDEKKALVTKKLAEAYHQISDNIDKLKNLYAKNISDFLQTVPVSRVLYKKLNRIRNYNDYPVKDINKEMFRWWQKPIWNEFEKAREKYLKAYKAKNKQLFNADNEHNKNKKSNNTQNQ